MTERVVSVSGKTVEVAASGGAGDVPAATTTAPGIVQIGDNIYVLAGVISVPYGTPSRLGVLKIGSRLTGGSDGTVNVPVGNRATAGVVKVGLTLSFSPDGTIDVYEASQDSPGIMKQAMPVPDVETIAVTDIESAQAAIAAMGTTLSQLMQSMRNSGQLGVSDG